MNTNILFSVPSYNCEKQIVRVLQKINNYKNLNFINEIIVIDNVSEDNTFYEAKKFENKINNLKVIQNKSNVGLGGSHKVIFDYALDNNFDYLILMHGDDQANIEDIDFFFNDKLFEAYSKYDWCRGSRFLKRSKLDGYSILKTIGNIFFNYIFSAITLRKIEDIGSGLDIYNVKNLKKIPYHNFPNDLTFDYYLILFCNYKKFKINYFPIKWNYIDQVSTVRLFKQTIKLLKTVFNFIFNKKFMFNKKN